jgi:hypothetical protein
VRLGLGLSLTGTAPAGGGGGGAYAAQAVNLDGTAFLSIESLTAPTDNGLCSIAFWYRMPVQSNGVLWVVDPNGNYPSNAYFSTPNAENVIFHQQFCSFDDSECWNANAPFDNTEVFTPVDTAWRCVLASVDTNHTDPDKIYNFYNGDTPVPYDFVSTGSDVPAPFLPNFNGFELYVFDDGFGDGLIADVSNFWMAPGQYIDFSVEANRRKFIDANGKPVDLGADGSTPTGTAPAVFFSGDASGFGTNKGTGGTFTLTGALTDATTGPSD